MRWAQGREMEVVRDWRRRRKREGRESRKEGW